MGNQSRQYVLLRASRTLQCMTVIKNGTPSWEWGEQTVAQFTTKYQECLTLIDSEADEAADTTGARGTRDANLATLREKGRLALALSKIKYRNNPPKLRLFSGLAIKSDTVAGTLEEALAVDSAWEQADPAYVLDDGTTLAAFNTLRLLCRTNADGVSKEAAEESDVAGTILMKLDALYDLCVAWYAVATALYPEATPHGIMIRGQIPTQPSSGGAGPGQATLEVEGGIGLANFTFSAEGAQTFTLQGRLVGAPAFADLATGLVGPTHQQTGLAVGNWEFIAMAHNLDGDGEPSEVVTAEVT
jgi:hypothetical protein